MWWGQRVRASREEPKQRALQKKRRGLAESREVMMGMCEAAADIHSDCGNQRRLPSRGGL